MADTHLQHATDSIPHEKFVKGLRAVFGTSKAESDRQMAEDAELRKEQRSSKPAKKTTTS